MPVIAKRGNMHLLFASSLLVSVFFSCSDDSKNEAAAFKTLNESLINSNRFLVRSSQMVLAELNKKLMEPASSVKAGIWFPKAQLVQKYTADIIGYIENFKIGVRKDGLLKSDQLNDLYAELRKYKTNLIGVDSEMAAIFDTLLIITSRQFDSKQNSKEDFNETFFEGVSIEAATSLLSKFQNNARIIENMLTNFCNNKVASYDDYYDTYSVIVGQNSSYVRAGQKVEITAGVGVFSIRAKPDVMIKGQKVAIDENGVAIVQIPASSKPGKHFIPVEINFIDQSNKTQTIVKTVEYTVAKE